METASKIHNTIVSKSVVNAAGGGKTMPAVAVLQQKTEEQKERSSDVSQAPLNKNITRFAAPSPPALPPNNKVPLTPFVAQRKSTGNDQYPELTRFNPVQKKANNTGLPDNLKSGIENLSGFSMDDVRVHYNSSKPTQLQAYAFAQGTDIHLASGQEKHLPHEAWHVVQQKQGRVQATTQMKGDGINDDPGLESEADTMGLRAVQLADNEANNGNLKEVSGEFAAVSNIVQRKVGFEIEIVHATIESGNGRALAKGEALHQGVGWKLTPDSGDGNSWTPEYIIAAIDETTGAEEIVAKMTAVADHATNQLDHPGNWSNGANLETTLDDEILGNFHVTGGLRLSQISKLIKLLYADDAELVDRAESTSWSGDNYKSVVALVALRISDLVNYETNARHDGKSAKRYASILSRTDLGAVVSKVTKFTKKATFIADVIRAAGVDANANLFNNQLPAGGGAGREIDSQQGLTATQWLDKLLTGQDFTWSETVNDRGEEFGFEKVGPPELGILNHRVDGVILELRSVAEQGAYSPPVEDWVGVARKYGTLFRLLNKKASITEVVAGLNPE
jgi:hypothetical protein